MANLERLKRALQAAHAAGDTAAATKLAQAIRAAQATPSTPAGDTSMGTAFAVADKQAEAAGNLGSAAITRRVNQGPLGQAQEFMFDKFGNPIREFFGMDPVDIAAVNQASSDEATAKATQAQQAANQFAEDSNFENLTLDSVNDLGSFFKYVGQKGAQAAPYMAVSMASGGTATYPFSVGEISGALEDIEGKTQEEKDKIATRGGAIMTALENLGIASLLPAGVSNNIIGGIASGAISEGFTEGVQELVVIGSEAVAGKKFTEEELVSRLKEATAAGAAVGGSFKAGGQTVNATSKIFSSDGSVNNPDNMSAEGAAAAGAFARRLREIAQANEYDLKDVNANSTAGARETVDKAHIQLAEELKKVFKDLGELVTPDKLKTFIETKDQILAQAAYREARNKTKSTVGQQELDAMRRLVGDTAEGQQAINLMLQLNQLTEVHNAGYKGGLSRITDVFNPLDQNINSYDTASRVVTGTLSPLATAAGAVSTGGASLAPQAALFGTGRAVDAMTGRRSTVDRFVRRNEGNSPDLPAPTAPSLVETKRLQEQQAQDETQRNQEQQKQLNLQLAQQGAPATPGSPQFTMEDATGLSRDGVARILRVLKGRNDNPALIRAIQEYEQSVATGGRIEDLSPLIRAVRQFQEQNPDYVPMVRPPNSLSNPMLATPAAPGQAPNVDTTEANPVQAQTFGPQLTTQENYNRGIESNQAMNAQLVEGVTSDPELNRVQKGRLITSLDVLANNLGSDPVAAAQEQVQKLEEAGVPQEAIETYIQPYVDRVARQQAARVSPDEPMLPDLDVPTTDPKKPQAPRLAPEQIPTQTRKVYKLMKVQKSRPGEVLPLFAKSGGDKGPPSGYTFGEWFASEFQRPKLGAGLLAPRSGIHGVNLPVFDQGKAKVKGSQRVWVEAEIPSINAETQAQSDNSWNPKRKANDGILNRVLDPNESYDYKTNPNASNDAGGWPISGSVKILRVVPDNEIAQILRDNGLDHQIDNSFTDVDAVKAQELMQADAPVLMDLDPQKPALQSYVNPLQVPDNEIDATRLTTSPSEAEIQKMREGTYKPKTKRTLVEAADYMHQKWKAATGRDEPFEYTPENVDIISTYMATEAVNALQSDANAIGWYDRKLKAAKRVVSLVDPRVTQSPDAEVAFDFALAITSNGQAVADNFQYALEVFRHFMDNGQMPTTTWKKGGKRNAAMVEAFEFFNDYQASGTNLPIQEFLDQDFTVKELKDWAASFNERYGTNIKVPSSEGASEMVKGSFIAGPKIGQGFYQNIRGNYDPLTMDIWWMRMWNRLVGRPFVSEKDLDVNRARVRKALQTKNQDALEKRLTKETLKDMGLTRADLKKDAVLDDFVLNFASKYQSFYNKEAKRLKGTGQKVPKPELALATGTMKDNLSPQLQATPTGPGERSYMREVTKAAIAKLRDLGYNIETADFQALMWYPEKQLFRHLGVAPGRGADNDYLDAAIMLAEAEGITNDQIQEALPDADGDGTVNNQSDSSGAYENGNRGAGGNGPGTESPSEPILSDTSPGANPDGPRPDVIPAEKPQVTPEQYKQAVVELIRPQFQVGLKGGELEDGISNFNDAVEFAKKLGVVVRLAMSQNELNTLLKLDTGQDPAKLGTARGMFQRKGPKKQGKGTEGTIWAMKPGADKGDGTYVTDIEALTTLLHEISHAITLGPLDGKADQEVYSYFINRKQSSKPGTGIVGRSDFTPPGSFVDSAIKPLLDADWEQMSPTQKKAYAEIVDLQENVEAYSPKNPSERRAVRFIRQVMANPGYSQETKQAYKDYTRMAAEFAVDPVWVYLINPKLAKKLMPATSKMIQQEFRKANNKVIQFYAHPLAVVMAALVALEMAMDDDEERRQQQMPPGALNAPMAPGMLSQA